MRIPTPAASLLTLALCITACTTPGVTTPTPSEPTPVPTPVPGPVTPVDPDANSDMGGPYWLVSTQEQRTVSIDAAKLGRLSFKNGRVLSVEGEAPAGLTLTINGSVITLSAPAGLNVEMGQELILHYGAPGQQPLHSVPLFIEARPDAVEPEPDPDLGKTLPTRTVVLNWEHQTQLIDLRDTGLSFKDGRYAQVDSTWLNQQTITGSGTRDKAVVMFNTLKRTETERSYQVPVTYHDERGKILLKTNFTVIHQPDAEVISTLNNWTSTEQEMLRLVNEVRTKRTINGKDISGTGCLPNFDGVELEALKPLDSLRLAAWKQAYYLGEEGYFEETSLRYLNHKQPNASSPRYYGNELLERVLRAGKEIPDRMKPGGYSENLYANSDPNATATDAVMGWVYSTGHCMNMMHRGMTHVGYAMWDGDGLNDLHPMTGNRRFLRNFVQVLISSGV